MDKMKIKVKMIITKLAIYYNIEFKSIDEGRIIEKIMIVDKEIFNLENFKKNSHIIDAEIIDYDYKE